MAELKKFGEQMRAARKDKKMSMRELAEYIGLSAPYVSDVEFGRRAPFPPGGVYVRLAQALGGDEKDWSARGAAERVRMDVDGLPRHVGEFVRDVVLCAHGISSSDVKKMRDYVTALRR